MRKVMYSLNKLDQEIKADRPGIFHCWAGTMQDAYALIEDTTTGNMHRVHDEYFRFVTPPEKSKEELKIMKEVVDSTLAILQSCKQTAEYLIPCPDCHEGRITTGSPCKTCNDQRYIKADKSKGWYTGFSKESHVQEPMPHSVVFLPYGGEEKVPFIVYDSVQEAISKAVKSARKIDELIALYNLSYNTFNDQAKAFFDEVKKANNNNRL